MEGPQTNDDQGMRMDLAMVYGMLVGAGLGVLLLALTGNAMWMGAGPAIGLSVGIVIASLYGSRQDDSSDG